MPKDVDPKYHAPWPEELKANIRALALVLRCAPLLLVPSLVFLLLEGILPALVIYQMGRFVDQVGTALAAGNASWSRQSGTLILIIGAITITQLTGPIRGALSFGLQRRFQADFAGRVMNAINALPGLAYFEDPDFRDKLKVTEWVGWGPTQTINSLQSIIRGGSSLISLCLVAGSYELWVPISILAATVPAGIASVHFESWVGMARWSHSQDARLTDYFRKLSLTLEPAKELRIFRLKDLFLGRHQMHFYESVRDAWQKRRKSLFLQLGLDLPGLVLTCVAFLAMLRAAIEGTFTIGGFAAASAGVVAISSSARGIFSSLVWLRTSNYYLPVAFQIMDRAKKEPRLHIAGTLQPGPLSAPPIWITPEVAAGIEFQNVSFTYPGTELKVINKLDLTIPPGQAIALVGENGAGKTTLIKLLCRFYDPQEGSILWDGVDIREFDLESLRDRVAVIFQDFARYKLSARDNVGFGAVKHAGDHSMTEEAAAKVGVLDKIKELPEGWDTPLAKEFEGGVDLSGGEWQRIALARAIMAQIGRPTDVLILDEPTASLDVRVEHDLYEHFSSLRAGKTTLLVSHRFSTVRMADRIVFLEGGHIAEDGTHDELMALRGRYSELYEMQASHFRLTGELE